MPSGETLGLHYKYFHSLANSLIQSLAIGRIDVPGRRKDLYIPRCTT